MYKIPCLKCDGKGRIQGFSMVARGICFQCKGNGYFTVSKKQYKEYEKNEKERQELTKRRRREVLQEKQEAKLKDRAYWLSKNIRLIMDIEKAEDIKLNNEAMTVYKVLKEQVEKDLNDYKNYKQKYNLKIQEIEKILREFNNTMN